MFLILIGVCVSFLRTSAVVKALLVIILWAMTFALLFGTNEKSAEIQEEPLTRVLFESEKDGVAAVEGKVIFDLERYLLLFNENKADTSVVGPMGNYDWVPKLKGSVVAIPHEKIKSIQTPPLPKEQESAGD